MFFYSNYVFSYNGLKCVSMNNQEFRIKSGIISINNNEPILYPYSIFANKCKGSCNNINDPCAKLCVSHIAKDMNIKVFNLILRTNETRHTSWHETCKCKCRLDARTCNDKQRWNKDIYKCE